MKKRVNFKDLLVNIRYYLFFCLFVGGVVGASLAVFMLTFLDSMGMTLSSADIDSATKFTLLNVVIVSAILAATDSLRRKYVISRPIRKIEEATEKMSQGDFTTRIPEFKGVLGEKQYNHIAECVNKMAEELSSVETLRTDFVANVSHELKTPLAVMHGFGTMLQDPDLPTEKRLEYAKGITQASRQLSTLITNILKLNKLENQQITPVTEPYDLSDQVCECLLAFEELWEKKNIEIETDIEDGILVNADADMMSLVWNNLYSNAIKFTENGGKVTLQIKSEGEYAVVRVSDTGCGISPEVGKHMFDKFYQGDTSHATQGNGLGLALVKRIVDMTGSYIFVDSQVGEGTTFTVKMRRITNGSP